MWLFTILLTEFSPNPPSPQSEWVEMYNDSTETVNLDGYTIRDSTSSNKQVVSGVIQPQSYFIFSFDHDFLNNTSADIVRLFDKNNNLIDSQSSKSLPSGLSFSRQSDGSWCPTDISPNLPNNLCQNNYVLTNSPTPIPYISLKITNLNPDSETIEITNPNNFLVNLFDWRVRDNSGSIRKISCQSVAANSVCTATFSSGYLNNDNDRLTLLDPLKREISIYDYDFSKQTSAPKNTITKSPAVAKTNIIVPINSNQTYVPSHSSSVNINQSSPIHNYLSIILMFIGSIFILFPLIFHGKNIKK